MSTLSDIAAEIALLDQVELDLTTSKRGSEIDKRWTIEKLRLAEKYASDDLISSRARRLITCAEQPDDFYS